MKKKFFRSRYHFVDLILTSFFLLEILATQTILIVFLFMTPELKVLLLNISFQLIFIILFHIIVKHIWIEKWRYTKHVTSEAGKILGIHFIQSMS